MLCGRCRVEERLPGQRWGRSCFLEYMRAYMRTRRALKRKSSNERNAD